jgi:hypothetical protein
VDRAAIVTQQDWGIWRIIQPAGEPGEITNRPRRAVFGGIRPMLLFSRSRVRRPAWFGQNRATFTVGRPTADVAVTRIAVGRTRNIPF